MRQRRGWRAFARPDIKPAAGSPLRHLLAATALTLAAALPARAADKAPDPNATLIYFDAVSNQTLDPQEPQNNSSFAQGVLMAIYDSLVRLAPDGEPKPGLAESWHYNEDLTEITFTLRKGVTFHDGTPFNAAAVAKNFERSMALGPKAGGVTIETFTQVAGYEVVDDSTVRVKLKARSGQMPYLFGTQAGMMISPAVLSDTAFGATLKPIGTGPYRVTGFDSNVRTQTRRNDAYWEGIEGRPAGFEHNFVSDARARLNALRSGQANLALIEPRQIAEAKDAGFAVQINEKNSTWEIGLNTSHETVGKLKLRQAMMHAIDREALADALGYGASKPTVQFFAQSSPWFDPALEKLFPYDPDKARKLVAEAGYPKGVDISWLLLNTTEYKTMGEAVQSMLQEVGIRVKFDTVDVSQYTLFRRPAPGRGDVLMVRWGGRPDPLMTFQEFISGKANPWGAVVPEIDTLIDQARAMAPSDPKRAEVIHKLSRVATEQVAHMTLMTRSNVYAYKPGCVTNLPAYLPTGNDRMNDTRVGMGCK
ncbi:MAG: ABC transporter substrate-binding protein [Acetobacteraceae bacterium]